MATFEQELEALINRHSMEGASNTPDFILAQYLLACMEAFAATVKAREKWYGRDLHEEAAFVPAESSGG